MKINKQTDEADLSENFSSWVMCWIGGAVMGAILALLAGAIVGFFV